MFRFIFVLGALLAVPAYAQVSDKDSLVGVLKNKSLGDDERITTILLLCEYYKQNDFKSVIAYADSGLALAEHSSKLEKYFPKLLLLKGIAFRKQSMFDQANRQLQLALEKTKQLNDTAMEPKIYGELATVAEMQDQLVEALALDQKALDGYQALKDDVGISLVYNHIGIIYWTRKEHIRAREYFEKAIRQSKDSKDLVFKSRITNNIGLIFQDDNQYDSALRYFKEAISYIDAETQKYGYALVNNNMGIAYRALNQFDLALKHFAVAKDLQTELNDQFGLGLTNYNIGRTYFNQGNYRSCIQSSGEGMRLGLAAGNNDLLFKISQQLADAYEKVGDYPKAFRYEKMAFQYNDSLRTKGLNSEIADLEVKYKLKEQQAENDLLKAENQLNLSTLRNNKLMMTGSIVICLLVIAVVVIFYRASAIRLKSASIIEEKNEKLELLNREKNSLMGIVAHDLKSPFNSIGGIAALLPKTGPLNAEQLQMVQMIKNVVDNSANLIRELMDLSALENKDVKIHAENVEINQLIINCIAYFNAEAQQKDIALSIENPSEASVTIISDSHHLERILQNLISNAIKFSSRTTTVHVGCRQLEDRVQFYVRDEGPGISADDRKNLFKKFHRLSARPTNGESSTGLGLSIVKALVEELKGEIEVQSDPGQGASFICTFPPVR